MMTTHVARRVYLASSSAIRTTVSRIGQTPTRTVADAPRSFAQCWYSSSRPNGKIFKLGGGGVGKEELTPERMEQIMEEQAAQLQAEKEARTVFPDWKPGQRKRPLIKTYDLEEFERELIPEKYADNPLWTLRDKRCGALAIKVGMMPVWDDWGVRHACTILWLDRNIVSQPWLK